MDSVGDDVDTREKIDPEPPMYIMGDHRSERLGLCLCQCRIKPYAIYPLLLMLLIFSGPVLIIYFELTPSSVLL